MHFYFYHFAQMLFILSYKHSIKHFNIEAQDMLMKDKILAAMYPKAKYRRTQYVTFGCTAIRASRRF